ncbi:unnamed protein product, partial [Ixodes pacificus]
MKHGPTGDRRSYRNATQGNASKRHCANGPSRPVPIVRDAVREQVLLARIRVPALPAHVWRVTGVSPLVAAEVRRRLERLVARVALVGPLPRVAPPVCHQVVLGSKCLATEVAGEWPLPPVRHLVPGDVARVVAREGAVAAEEPALPCLVRLGVLLEGLPRGEEVVALLA